MPPLFPVWDPEFLGVMFQMTAPLAEKMLRPVVVYLFLIVLLRVFGKRELAQLNPFDLVVLLMLSNTVQNAIIGNDNSVTGALVGATSLCAFNYLVIRFLFRHRRLDQFIEGRPITLIRGGQLCKDAMRRELMTRSEVMAVIHRQGFAAVDEVERCVLEPGGVFYVEGRVPRTADRHHAEILARLDAIERCLAERPAST